MTRAAVPLGWSKASTMTWRTTPNTMTLLTVPRPGFWRSGIQRRSSSAPTMHTQTPVPIGVWLARPWCRTSHGTLPSPLSRISEALKP